HVPLRRCVACGTQRPKMELVHIVRTPQGLVTVDLGRRAAGRGAYLCQSSACWEQGLKKSRLEHALKVQISAQDRQRLQEFASNLIQPLSPGA
ncbi:MAG: YlxR family protein, partial [Dehalococcoidia bacterium]|nr:YlxR family protein [Dehalococcoidia bacterium]